MRALRRRGPLRVIPADPPWRTSPRRRLLARTAQTRSTAHDFQEGPRVRRRPACLDGPAQRRRRAHRAGRRQRRAEVRRRGSSRTKSGGSSSQCTCESWNKYGPHCKHVVAMALVYLTRLRAAEAKPAAEAPLGSKRPSRCPRSPSSRAGSASRRCPTTSSSTASRRCRRAPEPATGWWTCAASTRRARAPCT